MGPAVKKRSAGPFVFMGDASVKMRGQGRLPATVCVLLIGWLSPVTAGELKLAGEAMVERPAWSWNMSPVDSEKVVTYGDYQYTIYWGADAVLTLARRHIATNELQRLRFPDATLSRDDGHHSTAIGISPHDGRLHLAYDHWVSPLRYRRSTAGFLDDPPFSLSTSDFSRQLSMLGQQESRVTYPQFINLKDGTLLFLYRDGTSANGDHLLNRYDGDSGRWERVGKLFSRSGTYSDSRIGTSTARNAYPNDTVVDTNGRIHITWTWRETSGHESNHDLHYIYSDDGGNTWKNNAGRTVANLPAGVPVRVDSLGIRVAEIPTYSWLINQDAMVVDSRNQPHVVTHHSTVPAEEPGDRNIHYIHYWREPSGEWRSGWITSTATRHTSFRRRGALAIDPRDDLHFLVIEGGLKYYYGPAEEERDRWSARGLGSGYSGQGLRYDRRLWEKNQVLYASATHGSDNAYILPIFQWDRPEPRLSLGTVAETDEFEEWRLVKHLDGHIRASVLELTFQGNDPYLHRGGLGIDADRYRFLLIRMKHQGNGSEGAVFFVTHEGGGGWSYSRARLFPLGEPDGLFRDYLVDLGAHSRWRGGVTALRIDPVENAQAGDTAAIERIVLLERPPYEQWRLDSFSEDQLADSSISGDEAAPAGDGVTNLLKFALGLKPFEIARRSELPSVRVHSEGSLEIAYTRPKEVGDFTFVVESSTDLMQWEAVRFSAENVAVRDLGDREEIGVRAATAGGERQFLRLRVQR